MPVLSEDDRGVESVLVWRARDRHRRPEVPGAMPANIVRKVHIIIRSSTYCKNRDRASPSKFASGKFVSGGFASGQLV